MYTSLEATSPTGPIRTREHPLPRKTRVLWIFHPFIMFSPEEAPRFAIHLHPGGKYALIIFREGTPMITALKIIFGQMTDFGFFFL